MTHGLDKKIMQGKTKSVLKELPGVQYDNVHGIFIDLLGHNVSLTKFQRTEII